MFGVGRFRLGSALTVAVSVCLLVVRMFLVRAYYDHQGPSPRAGAVALQQSEPAAPPASSWLIFATTDRDTKVRMQHARLRADDPADGAASSPAPAGDYLELRSAAGGEGEAVVLLAPVPAAKCSAIDHISASFDGRPPESLAAEPAVVDAGCSVKIAGFDRFVQGLQNAQTLVLTPRMPGAALRDVAFHVAGLTWE